ncbi:SPX/RING-type Zinc finger domain containing protein [Cryptosporidium felis]|nr:SPX/RING-type Zinc finger domain containing protein [Cryptosporidium felis]
MASSKPKMKISESGLEIVKFSKGIQVQARNNRGTRYLNYKLLIRKIRWVFEQEEQENWVEAQRYDLIFKDILLRDMNRMDAMYCRDINYIRDLMCVLSKDVWSLTSPTFKFNMNLRRIEETDRIPLLLLSSLANSTNPGIELSGNDRRAMEWLHNLLECCGRLAKLRSYIIWNSIAVIKVLRKRRGKVSLKRRTKNPLDAYLLLNSHEFYKGVTLEYLNKNLRNLMLKIFKKDLFSDFCQKCNKRTYEPIKSICDHVLCWKCISNVDETFYLDSNFRSNSNGESNSGYNSIFAGSPLLSSKESCETDGSIHVSEKTTSVASYPFRKIRNRPFKNCPVCHVRWSRNPESLQVENEFIRLCIQHYLNTESLTGIPDIDTVLQSSVGNVGFISSDDETEDEFNSEGEAILDNNSANDLSKGGFLKPEPSHDDKNNIVSLPAFENVFGLFSRPHSSSISTVTSSNQSFDDCFSNSGNLSGSNSNLSSNPSNNDSGIGFLDFKNNSCNNELNFVISNGNIKRIASNGNSNGNKNNRILPSQVHPNNYFNSRNACDISNQQALFPSSNCSGIQFSNQYNLKHGMMNGTINNSEKPQNGLESRQEFPIQRGLVGATEFDMFSTQSLPNRSLNKGNSKFSRNNFSACNNSQGNKQSVRKGYNFTQFNYQNLITDKYSYNDLHYSQLWNFNPNKSHLSQYTDSFGISNFDNIHTDSNYCAGFHYSSQFSGTGGNNSKNDSITNRSGKKQLSSIGGGNPLNNVTSGFSSNSHSNIWSNYQRQINLGNKQSNCNLGLPDFSSNYANIGFSGLDYDELFKYSGERFQNNLFSTSPGPQNPQECDNGFWNASTLQGISNYNNGIDRNIDGNTYNKDYFQERKEYLPGKSDSTNCVNPLESSSNGNNIEDISYWNPFSSDNFIGYSDRLRCLSNNGISTSGHCSLSDELVSSDSKLLDLFRGLGV